MAASEIMLGYRDCVAVVGAEIMSNVPYFIPKLKAGLRRGDASVIDGMFYDGLKDSYHDKLMGEFADASAQREGVTAEHLTQFAQASYEKANRAKDSGVFKEEIVPIEVDG